MKKIMNTSDNFVVEMCHGIVRAHPELELIEKYRIIKKKDINPDKVSLVSGGGSGHEPAHAGYVGKGMLDAAVCGNIFASPAVNQITTALRSIATDKGILIIIKNYSGDCSNFKEAAETVGKDFGIKVDYVIVNDDIAVQDSSYTIGRRGVAGTVLVEKIAGAAAEKGLELAEVKRLAEKTIKNVKSFGFALSSCTPPAKGTPIFDLADDDMEFGVGIHGEPGVKTEKFITSAELAERIVPMITKELNSKKGDRIALMINGFGATPLMELYLFNNDVSATFEAAGLEIYRTFVGNYMTSIDMEGASVTALLLDDELAQYLDAPSSAPAFNVGGGLTDEAVAALDAMKAISKALGVVPAAAAVSKAKPEFVIEEEEEKVYEVVGEPVIGETINTPALINWIGTMADIVIKNEVPFCDADKMGDGDFGSSIASGFRELKKAWKSRKKDDIGTFLVSASEIIKTYCGGASGPIWGNAFLECGKAAAGKQEISLTDIGNLLQTAVKAIQHVGEQRYGKAAVVGDKTLIDALVPCADAVCAAAAAGDKLIVGLEKGAKAAVDGAASTAEFKANLGRCGVVGEKSIGYPDAGAYGVGVIFTEMVKAIK